MFADTIIAAAATAHSIDADGLARILGEHGWDFAPLTETDQAVEFVTNVVNSAASKIADRLAKIEASKVAANAARIAAMTPAARNAGALVCGKCDGKGRLQCFSHIERGTCFWCKGAGVILPRRRA